MGEEAFKGWRIWLLVGALALAGLLFFAGRLNTTVIDLRLHDRGEPAGSAPVQLVHAPNGQASCGAQLTERTDANGEYRWVRRVRGERRGGFGKGRSDEIAICVRSGDESVAIWKRSEVTLWDRVQLNCDRLPGAATRCWDTKDSLSVAGWLALPLGVLAVVLLVRIGWSKRPSEVGNRAGFHLVLTVLGWAIIGAVPVPPVLLDVVSALLFLWLVWVHFAFGGVFPWPSLGRAPRPPGI
jgi:hypothetical protein